MLFAFEHIFAPLWLEVVFIFTARKEGNVFTGVCLFTGGRVSLVPGPYLVTDRMSLPGGVGLTTHPWKDYPLEGLPPGRATPEGLPPPRKDNGIRSASRRYASYWNAFLFLWVVCVFCMFFSFRSGFGSSSLFVRSWLILHFLFTDGMVHHVVRHTNMSLLGSIHSDRMRMWK